MRKPLIWLISCISSKIRNRIINYSLKYSRSFFHFSAIRILLKELNINKVDYLDIGARRGVDYKHWEYRDFLNFILFEPDTEECVFLNKYYNDVRNIAVNEKTEIITLNITADPGGSYTSENLQAEISYKDEMLKAAKIVGLKTSVTNKIHVQSKRLDECELKNDILILKIDVQGEELSVLKSLGKLRPACLKIEVSSGFEYLQKSQLEEILNWASKNNYLLVGTNFPGNFGQNISPEFNVSLHGDYYFIDQNFKKDERTKLLVVTGLIIFDSLKLATTILGQHPLAEKISSLLKNSSDFRLSHALNQYNNAHDKRRFEK